VRDPRQARLCRFHQPGHSRDWVGSASRIATETISKHAIELYLEQYATGDSSAVVSLRWAAGEALAGSGDDLAALAAMANTRSVVTAYLILQRARRALCNFRFAHDKFRRRLARSRRSRQGEGRGFR